MRNDDSPESISLEAAHDLMRPARALCHRARTLLAQLESDPTSLELQSDLQRVCQSVDRLLAALQVTTAEHGHPATRAEARHELATPLNHIIGYCELWMDEVDGGTIGAITELAIIRDEAWELLHSINELLGSGSGERVLD